MLHLKGKYRSRNLEDSHRRGGLWRSAHCSHSHSTKLARSLCVRRRLRANATNTATILEPRNTAFNETRSRSLAGSYRRGGLWRSAHCSHSHWTKLARSLCVRRGLRATLSREREIVRGREREREGGIDKERGRETGARAFYIHIYIYTHIYIYIYIYIYAICAEFDQRRVLSGGDHQGQRPSEKAWAPAVGVCVCVCVRGRVCACARERVRVCV